MEIYRVEIPQHIRKVQLSAKQRPKYFEWNGDSIKGKNLKVPVKFFNKDQERQHNVLIEHLKNKYFIGIVDKGKLTKLTRDPNLLPNRVSMMQTKIIYRLYLEVDDTIFIPVLTNPKTVNTPRNYLIKGQDIYNGYLREHMRGTVMDAIKECYKPYIENLPVINSYPVRIECEIHDTIKNYYDKTKEGVGQRWDIDNYAYCYLKAFPDIMVKLGKLKDDDRMHLTQPPSAIFCPIEKHSERKLVFIISKDERDVITNNEAYKSYHKDSYESEDTLLVKDDEPFNDFGVILDVSKEQSNKMAEVQKIFQLKIMNK